MIFVPYVYFTIEYCQDLIRTSLHATTGDIQIDKMVHCERGLLSAVTVLLVMAEVGHSLDVKMELAFVVYLILQVIII